MSGELCLSHFLSAIRVIDEGKIENSNDVIRELLKAEIRHLKPAEQRLSKFIRKHNWEYRDKPRGSETEANRIALNLLASVEGFYVQSCKSFAPLKMCEILLYVISYAFRLMLNNQLLKFFPRFYPNYLIAQNIPSRIKE